MDLSFPQLEGILDGISKNSERLKDEIEGNEKGDANDLLAFIEETGGSL